MCHFAYPASSQNAILLHLHHPDWHTCQFHTDEWAYILHARTCTSSHVLPLLSVKFCVRPIMRESCNFELAHQKKEKGKILDVWLLGTFAMLFTLLGALLVINTVEDECYIVIKAYVYHLIYS